MRIMSACLVLSLAVLPLQAGDRVTGRAFATRSEVAAQHGMACTSQALVTQIALDVLKQGGSAVDAAIAADAALGLMEPTGSGMAAICTPSSGTPRRSSCTASTPADARRNRSPSITSSSSG